MINLAPKDFNENKMSVMQDVNSVRIISLTSMVNSVFVNFERVKLIKGFISQKFNV